MVKIGLERVDIQKKITVEALPDGEATELVIYILIVFRILITSKSPHYVLLGLSRDEHYLYLVNKYT